MVYNLVFWLNSFPQKDHVHATISPRTLLTGLAIEYIKHCKVAFGRHVQVPGHRRPLHYDQQEMNKGGYHILSLHSGKKVNRYAWTELPMSNEVIKQVHRFSRTAENYEGIEFTLMQGNTLEDQMNEGDNYNASEEDTSNTQEEQSRQEANSTCSNEDNEDETTEEAMGISDYFAKDVEDVEIDEEPDELSDESKDRITIEDINITMEVNTSQLAIQQQEPKESREQDVPTTWI